MPRVFNVKQQVALSVGFLLEHSVVCMDVSFCYIKNRFCCLQLGADPQNNWDQKWLHILKERGMWDKLSGLGGERSSYH